MFKILYKNTWYSDNGKWKVSTKVIEQTCDDNIRFITGDVVVSALDKYGNWKRVGINNLPKYVRDQYDEGWKLVHTTR